MDEDEAREAEYIRISHLTHLRDAYAILHEAVPDSGPFPIPQEEYRQVMRTIDGWIAKLERRGSDI